MQNKNNSNNIYSTQFQKEFFNRFYKDLRNHPDQLAIEYVKSFYNLNMKFCEDRESRPLYTEPIAKINHINNRKIVTIASEINSFEFITKRASLITDQLILTEQGNTNYKIEHHQSYSASYNGSDFDEFVYLKCNNINELGSWLINCKDLLIDGNVLYYPNLHYEMSDIGDIKRSGVITELEIIDAIFENSLMCRFNKNILSKSMLRPIMTLEIPYIEGIPLTDFSKILLDNQDIIQVFKLELNEQLLSINPESSENELQLICSRIENNMNYEILKIKELYQVNLRKYFKDLITIGIPTASIMLLVINSGINSSIIKEIIGTGAIGLLPLIKTTADYIENRLNIKKNPYFFLWLLRK